MFPGYSVRGEYENTNENKTSPDVIHVRLFGLTVYPGSNQGRSKQVDRVNIVQGSRDPNPK